MGVIEKLKIQTEVKVQLFDKNGKLKREEINHNLITNKGLQMIADRAIGGSKSIVSKVAIGNSDATVTRTDTALGTKLAELAAVLSRQDNVITYEANFTQETAFEIKEAGLFNNDDELYARVTFPVVNKGITDSVKITWKWAIQ